LGSFVARLGNLAEGHRFVSFAKSLLNRLAARESAGEILCVAAEVQSFVEPILAANELRAQGEEECLRVGDVYTACLCRMQYCNTLFWAGTNLHVVEEKYSAAKLFITRHDHKTLLASLYIQKRSVDILLGNKSQTESRDDVVNVRQRMIL
jgi:hypothetical protein